MIDDPHGIFVSPKGDDTSGDGSMAAPYATLGKALDGGEDRRQARVRLRRRRRLHRFHVDRGREPRRGGALRGLPLQRLELRLPRSRPAQVPTDPVAMKVTGLVNRLHIEDFDIEASDATTAGDSTIAMWVDSSDKVSLKHVKLVAGTGRRARMGRPARRGRMGLRQAAAQDGEGCLIISRRVDPQLGGAWSGASACGSLGGAGGTGKRSAVRGDPGKPRSTGVPAHTNGGAAGTTVGSTADGGPVRARTAPQDYGGRRGFRRHLSASGFAPADGHNGSDGTSPRAAVAAARAREAGRALAPPAELAAWAVAAARWVRAAGRRRERRAVLVVEHGDAR